MANSLFMIEDLKIQVNRLSEERALFYALSKEYQEEAKKHETNVRVLANELDAANKKIEELERGLNSNVKTIEEGD